MIAYHGSSHNIKKIRTAPKLSSETSRNNEGPGCYFFTDSKKKAASYGKFVYTLEIDDPVPDFRRPKTTIRYLENMAAYVKSAEHIDIRKFLDFEPIADYVADGRISVRGIPREVWLGLDSNPEFYEAAGKMTDIERIRQCIKQYGRKFLPHAWLFSASIENAGIVVQEDCVRILKKEYADNISSE